MIVGGPAHEGPGLPALARLRDRELKEEGIVIAEGRLLAERLLRAERFAPVAALCLPGLFPEFESLARGRCQVFMASEPEMASIAGFQFHRGVLAAARRPKPLLAIDYLHQGADKTGPRRALALPEVRDPENLGSIFRSAAALGFEAVFIGPACADPLSRRCLRVSMGSSLSLPFFEICEPGDLGSFTESGFRIAGAVLDTKAVRLDAWRPPEKLLLLFGNEYSGLDGQWKAACSELVTHPMAGGADSLNLAVAAAIFMYEIMKTSRTGDTSP